MAIGIVGPWFLCLQRPIYTFDSRYLLEATVRRDGSSRFGKGNKFGVFPSVGAGWNLHEEAFMKPLKDQISEFKVRASYGLFGQAKILGYISISR